MRWMSFFCQARRRQIVLWVILAHSAPLFFLTLEPPPKPKIAKPIVVHTFVQKKAATAPPKIAVTGAKKKAVPQKKKAASKKNNKEIEKIFAKIEKAQTKLSAKVSLTESPLPELALSSNLEKADVSPLFDYLQQLIELPKKGTVKLSFLVDSKGRIKELIIVEGSDKENENYLKEFFSKLLIPKELISSADKIELTLHGVEN